MGGPGRRWRQRGAHRSPGGGGKPKPPVLLHGAPAGPQPHSPRQHRPFARRGGGGSHLPSQLRGNLDERRLHVRNVFAGFCHHLQTSLPPPYFFSPLTATVLEGGTCAGSMGKWGLGVLCSSSSERIIWRSFLSSKAWFCGRTCFLQQEKTGERRTAFRPAYPPVAPAGSTLSRAPQNVGGLWKWLKAHAPPAPSLSPARIGVGCTGSIISTCLAATRAA